ncbi:hypothetical protein D3Z45_08550 [Lachnospiraceae bacterium]|nr:hypothetical protein [Lachnospiraceae bacterium]
MAAFYFSLKTEHCMGQILPAALPMKIDFRDLFVFRLCKLPERGYNIKKVFQKDDKRKLKG